MVQRMGADGWQVTPMEVNYFQYNRVSYKVKCPVHLARPVDEAEGEKTG